MNNNLQEDPKVQELVAMLDQLMSQGGGHVDVRVEDRDARMTVKTTRSTDCAMGNLACCVPTLHQGLDDQEEQEEKEEN